MKKILLCLILLKNTLIAMEGAEQGKVDKKEAGFIKIIYPPKNPVAKVINIPLGFLLRPLLNYNGELREENKLLNLSKELLYIPLIGYFIKLVHTGIDLKQPLPALLKQLTAIPFRREFIFFLCCGIPARHAIYCSLCEPETKETYIQEIKQELASIQPQIEKLQERREKLNTKLESLHEKVEVEVEE